MTSISDPSTYAGTMRFEGSNDGFSWDIDQIFVIQNDFKSGWNTFDIDTEINRPKKSYRLINDKVWNGCNGLGEMQLLGWEAIENWDDDANCDIEVVKTDGQVFDTGSGVDYKLEDTPIVDSISPQFGSVEGGTLITINGRNFGSTVPSVTFDEIECHSVTRVSDE